MPLHIRTDGDIVVLSNFARLMNDPRYNDAGTEVQQILDQGYRKFVIELAGVRETGSAAVGLLVTITRRIRQQGGDVVLAHLSQPIQQQLDDFHMDDYWEFFKTVEAAETYFRESH